MAPAQRQPAWQPPQVTPPVAPPQVTPPVPTTTQGHSDTFTPRFGPFFGEHPGEHFQQTHQPVYEDQQLDNLTMNANCTLAVPRNPLTAQGLATPYVLCSAGMACSEDSEGTAAFVQATILDPKTGALSVYDPVVETAGTALASYPAGARTAQERGGGPLDRLQRQRAAAHRPGARSS